MHNGIPGPVGPDGRRPDRRRVKADVARVVTDTIRGVQRASRWQVKDVAVRTGAVPYRPLRWTAARWDAAYRSRDTDAYGRTGETARYGVLLGYLASVGGKDARVLDVGCGAGLLRRRMAAGTFGSYLGVDPTPAAIDQAVAEVRAADTAFVCADPLEADLDEHDVVVCNEVLYFAPDPFRLIDHLERLLSPSGHLLCSMFRHPGDAMLWRHLDARFSIVDRVHLRSEGQHMAPKGWTVACYAA